MKLLRRAWAFVRLWGDRILWLASLASIVVGVTGFVLDSLNATFLKLLQDNWVLIWFIALTLLLITVILQYLRLESRFTRRFTDNFNRTLREKWDYVGSWRIVKSGGRFFSGELLVTRSHVGGITKIGANWENYTFSFETRIINKCLGIVIRAKDLDNYYMLQLGRDKIRPHRRVAVPHIVGTSPDESEETHITSVGFSVGWQIFEGLSCDLHPPLDGWLKCKVVVRGESISLHINDEIAFQEDSFLKNPVGKVGFRNYGDERALVRNVTVAVDTHL